MAKKQTHAQGQEQKPILTGVFSPAKALHEMVSHFGNQLSINDLHALQDDQFHLTTLATTWAEITERLSLLNSENDFFGGKWTSQEASNLLLAISLSFTEIRNLIELDRVVQERIEAMGGEQ